MAWYKSEKQHAFLREDYSHIFMFRAGEDERTADLMQMLRTNTIPPPSSCLVAQPDSPNPLLCPSSQEAASDHTDREYMVIGCFCGPARPL